jgi:DNA-binding protein YbaB
MFGNIMQNLGNLSKLKSMQDALKKEVITYEKAGVKVTIRGDMEIQKLEIDGVENRTVSDTINEAMKKIQMEAAKKMMQMGG